MPDPQMLFEVEMTTRILAGAVLLFWVLLLLDRYRWWPLQWSLHLDTAARSLGPEDPGQLCVIVPARNEAAMLPRTLPRLLKQSDWYRCLVLVDDRSEDRTSDCARRLAAGTPAESKLRLVRVQEPPEGSGKVAAMLRGLQEATYDWAGDPSRQWILFTDADIQHPTGSIGRLLTKAGQDDLDLVSVMVRLRAKDFWEWLLIPPFAYFFQLLYPFRKVSDPARRVAAAAGGCVLVRRSTLEDAGGLDSIRHRRIDDVALARRVKQAGGKLWLGLDPDLVSLRPYNSYRQLRDMVARTAFEQLGHHYLLVPVVWLAMAALFIAPPLLAVAGLLLLDPWVAVPGALAFVLSSIHFLPVVQYLGVPSGFALTLPIAALLYAHMTGTSAWRSLRGRQPRWRELPNQDLGHG